MPIDYSKFKETFINEAKTYIKLMNHSLIALEKNPENEHAFQQIIRAVHTLKSLSSTMNYNQIMNLCHAMEDLLEFVSKKSQLENHVDVLFECFDYLDEDIKCLADNKDELDSTDLIQTIKNILEDKEPTLKKMALNTFPDSVASPEKIQIIEVKVERLDALLNLTEELLVNKMRFDLIKEEVDHPELTPAVESLGRLVTDLQYQVMQMRLVPIGFVFNRFLRMTRDLAKKEKKIVNLEIEGGEIEFDRLLIDAIGESIVHLIRNAIDHGIESPKIRKNKGKPAAGTLQLEASRLNESARIEIRDDGAGLDWVTIKKLAIQQKLLPQDANDEKVKEIIFSNLSTKKTVSPISGRGLGLVIVKQKIESIGGSIKVESTVDQGTTFIIEFPLSLAIIKTLFVEIGPETYAIPLDMVERLLVVEPDHFKGLLEHEAIIFEGDEIPVICLAAHFNVNYLRQEKTPIVIVRKGEKRLGLIVDRLLSTQEVVVKPLSRPIKHNKFFSGAALIGSGQMILILDIGVLLPTRKSAIVS